MYVCMYVLCMYVCICVCIYIYIFIYIYNIHVNIYICVCVRLCLYVCIIFQCIYPMPGCSDPFLEKKLNYLEYYNKENLKGTP